MLGPILLDEYVEALVGFVESGGEEHLSRAYAVGRRAVDEGKSLLDLAELHHTALAMVSNIDRLSIGERILRASHFFAEALSSFEMSLRGYREANVALAELNESLEQRVTERTRELQQQIEERERAEEALLQTTEQLRHSQRLEAIGRLAGGVAHDFNNILSVVLGYSHTILEELDPAAPCREDVEEISRAGHRAADLTRQLLAFSRQQVLRARIIDLNDVITGMERMLRRVLGEDIELHVAPCRDLKRVVADSSQIEQVLMNLAVNARDAMLNGGKLTIETANVELDDEYVSHHLEATPGQHVMLAVSDTGTGMDKATLSRIFEPFFTTKEKGKGTGLGLSTVFGIVKQSGGSIWAYSEPGRGATFKIYLPVTSESGVEPQPAAPRVEVHGTEAVLLVEDDDQLRRLAALSLQRYGYRVLPCRSGLEAITLAAQERIDLAVTDVVMPEMSGRELAERLQATTPSLRILFVSGYADDAVVRHGVLDSSMEYLQKPFTPATLAARVREVLDANRVN
jgi:two-component system, cell cycle sensor histidine kinase and response regulator CckA